jgi:RHS repeat-associated protein
VKRLLALFVLLTFPQVAHAQQAEIVEYYAQDVIGSIRVVFDVNGTVRARQDYAPFGRQLFPVPAMPKEGFGAQEKDAETEQGYFHARMLQARTGRFTAVDRIFNAMSEPQAWNRYAYALNRPLVFTDPTGTNADPCAGTDYNTGTCVTGHSPTNPDWSGDGPSCRWPCSWNGGGGGGGSFSGGGGGRGTPSNPTTPTTGTDQDPTTSPNPHPSPPGPNPPGPPGPKPPACDPVTGANCGPSPRRALVKGFLEGSWDTILNVLSSDSCLGGFAADAVGNMMPFPPSAANVAQPVTAAAAAIQFNRTLAYAASRPNYLGGSGLMYPFKSSVFRSMYGTASTIANEGSLVAGEVLAIGQALYSEYKSAASGQCK